jgi:hypothetical protein
MFHRVFRAIHFDYFWGFIPGEMPKLNIRELNAGPPGGTAFFGERVTEAPSDWCNAAVVKAREAITTLRDCPIVTSRIAVRPFPIRVVGPTNERHQRQLNAF